MNSGGDLYRELFHNSPSPMLVLSESGDILDANHAASDFLSKDREELLSSQLTDICDSHSIERLSTMSQESFEGLQLVFISKDGSQIPSSVSVFQANLGKCLLIHKTERAMVESMEKALAKSKYETKKLLEAASAVLMNDDFHKSSRLVFDIAKEMTGAQSGYVALLSEDGSENEVLFLDSGGLPCTVDPELPMPIRGLRETSYRENTAVYDNDFMDSDWLKFMPDGHVRLDNVMFGPLVINDRAEGLIGLANKPGGFVDDDKRIVMALSNLVAIGLKRNQLETMLRDNKDRLRETATELELYTSLLRHDLLNDLQLLFTEIDMSKTVARDEPLIADSFTRIESAAERMLRLIRVFKRSTLTEEDDLRDTLIQLVEEARRSYSELSIKIEDDTKKERITTRGRTLLPFVFDNLIRNTIQHVGEEAEIEIYLMDDEDYIVIDVVDNGSGVSPEIRSQLFSRGVTTRQSGGQGLYLCRRLIDSYDGSIVLLDDEIYDRGAAFRIRLPSIGTTSVEIAH